MILYLPYSILLGEKLLAHWDREQLSSSSSQVTDEVIYTVAPSYAHVY